jgi:hypothetical protein
MKTPLLDWTIHIKEPDPVILLSPKNIFVPSSLSFTASTVE